MQLGLLAESAASGAVSLGDHLGKGSSRHFAWNLPESAEILPSGAIPLAPALLPFASVLNVFRSKTRGMPRVIGIELGGLTSRAVYLERSGEQVKVLKFSVRESPLKQENLTPAGLAEHFQKLAKDLQANTKDLVVALGMEEGILQRVQMPRTSKEELRQILKLSGSKYFPQDITNHIFD